VQNGEEIYTLGLLAEDDDVGNDVVVLVSPELARKTHTALDLCEERGVRNVLLR
jgi:hypothetical protein